MLLTAHQVVTPARVHAPGWVEVAADRIVGGGGGRPPRPPDVDLGETTLVPGFVDAHVHGGGGASFEDATPAAVRTAVEAHLAHGTTSMTASLVSDTVPALVDRVGRLAPLVAEGLLAGTHLEGPWLSPERAGAHDATLLCEPTPDDVERLLAAGAGTVRMVTLAPELDGGLDAVRRLTATGVVVAVGHTDATYDVVRASIGAGARVGTHLFNAMRGLHHREPGPVAALLEHPGTFVELVADGVHVHPSVIRLAAAAKPRHVLLVTDAMAAAAGRDGDYRLGSMAVTVRDGVARLAGSDRIAASTLTLGDAVRYAVRQVGLPLADAVRAATSTPATMLGLRRVGALRRGYRADLVVLDDELCVRRVMRAGTWVA